MSRTTLWMMAGAVIALGTWRCSGIADSNGAGCGPKLNTASSFTVSAIPGNNLFSLTTPLNASSSCNATYTLTFRHADPARAISDSNMPILAKLDSVFFVNADTTVITHGAPVRSKSSIYEWKITASANNAGASNPKSTYYMKVAAGSTTLRDSVLISGSIDFYLQK